MKEIEMKSNMHYAGCCLMALFCTASDSWGADWVGFRGPVPKELVAGAMPLSWTPEEHVRWSRRLTGFGQSSPVIWHDHLFVTTVEGPKKETCHLSAYRLNDGELEWQYSLKNASPVEVSAMISKAAPTAVVDADLIVAMFEGGNAVAVTHQGEKVWERDLVAEYGPVESRHGLGSSLVEDGDHVIIWVERNDDPYILCLDKKTGATVWKIPGLKAGSWSSPVVLEVSGERQLVFSASGKVCGFNPENGESLWTMEGLSGNATPSPTVVGDGLLLIGATDARGESGGSKPAQSNCVIRVTKGGSGAYTANFVWRAKRATCSFGSPIVHQGLAYFVNRTGVLYCLDAETGEEVYAERTSESCWATPLAVEDRIYLVGQKGTTTVIKAGRQFEILSTNRLWTSDKETEPAASTTNATGRDSGGGFRSDSEIQFAVVAVPGSLFIRTGDRLFCVRE